jgi:predicted RND superfamily exporter protein
VQRALQDDILPRIEQDYGVAFQLSGQAADEREFLSGAGVALIVCLLGIYLTLAWIFAHWTRPLVVMAVIPFGLVGAIWGHWVWGVPLSLFSVVGLIGMAGIIINDAIVLVTTIDEYQEKRGLFPAIVDGVADRFRPVLLTTLTTVLGLAPLLYEKSSQAEFLKPTVITLVFGLGFGMVLVLLVVPALMAVQADIAGTVRALRRVLWGQRVPMRRFYAAAMSGMVALALVVMGPVIWSGSLPGWIVAVLPAHANAPAALVAFGVTMVGAGLMVALAVGASVIGMGRRLRIRGSKLGGH